MNIIINQTKKYECLTCIKILLTKYLYTTSGIKNENEKMNNFKKIASFSYYRPIWFTKIEF